MEDVPPEENTEITPTEVVVKNERINETLSISDYRSPQNVADLGRDCTALHHVFGVDSSRKGNMNFIEHDTIIYATATAVVFQHVSTSAKEYLMSIGDGGVGCVAVHPTRKIFAVGGKGYQPNIYIYSYPAKKLLKVLSGGAERGYSCMNFSADGDKLASVSTSPDFMLTIWDWQDQQMGLHSKAFGQDIYNVSFSQDDPGRLTTSGVGHIRFWKMASTFTGLKLQGSIGKFGKIDLSDIDTFVEMPDGKVISSTESGALLVWEGHFIKCRLTRTGGVPCHTGPVTFLSIDRVEKRVISAAQDGFIRWWDFAEIDNAEVDSDHSMDFELEPVAELFLGENIGVRSMVDSGSAGNKRLLVILDTTGRMQSLTFSVHEKVGGVQSVLPFCETIQSLVETTRAKLSSRGEDEEFLVDEEERYFVDKRVFEKYHSAAITGMDTCPVDNLVATCSTDGTVRCVDYVRRQLVAFRAFASPATCLKWLPQSLDPSGKMVAVGFADGVVRVLSLGQEDVDRSTKNLQLSFLRKMVFKPHNAPITDISFSSDGNMLATSGSDGIVFFFQCCPVVDTATLWTPIRFVTMLADPNGITKNPVSCKSISWSADGYYILCVCTDGVLREVELKSLRSLIGQASGGEAQEITSFEAEFSIRDVNTRVPLPSTAASMAKSGTAATLALSTPGKLESQVSALSTGSPLKGDTGNFSTNNSVTSETRPNTASTQGESVGTAMTAVTVGASVPAKINAAIHTINRDVSGVITAASLNQKNYTFEGDQFEELPFRELSNGLYTTEGKDQLKNPLTTSFRYSRSKRFLVCGLSDGSVTLRPSEYIEVFARAAVHSAIGNGTAFATTSYDDRYLVSAGSDGTLVVRRIRLDLFFVRAQTLYQDLDAGVFGNAFIKPEPLNPAPEPNYLQFVSTLLDSAEKTLFGLPTGFVEPPHLPVLQQAVIEQEEKDVQAGAYSIQDNRLKLEEDHKKVAAEELKNRVRASIVALRGDYENILRENDIIPEVARLTPDELLVDQDYLQILAEEGQRMIEEVHKECEHDAEKAEMLLTKLSKRMQDGLLLEETVLSAFYPPSESHVPSSTVRSFRARALDPTIDEILVEVHKMVKVTELKEAQQRTNEVAQRKAHEAMHQMMNRMANKENGIVEEDNDDAAIAMMAQLDVKDTHAKSMELSAASAAEESTKKIRQERRIARKDELKKHLTQKPNEDEDDVRDINAITLAEKTIGDYKLKCADDYEVPEDQRNNATKKLRQMAMLEESMLSMRLQFNERFLALRNLKRQMIYAVRRDNKRIREIDVELEQPQQSDALWEPRFDPEEFPEDADEVTEEELLQYEKERQSLPWEKVKPPPHAVVTGTKVKIVKNARTGTYDAILHPRVPHDASANPLENILSDSSLVDFTPPRTDPPKYYEVNPSILQAYIRDPQSAHAQRLYELEQKIPSLRRIRSALNQRMHLQQRNENQQTEVLVVRRQLEFERTKILSQMRENIAAFGEAVDDLRTDRHAISADLKLAELKLLVLFQEYQLLQTFEGRDAALQQKQIKCKTEDSEIKALKSDNKSKLETKEEELQHWADKIASISGEFKAMLPDSHPYCETLTKIFKKKIKRNKGREDGDDEEDFDDDGNDDDGDDEDEEEVEDICPPGCDQTLFERILDLREKKLDTEEVCGDIQKGIEDLRRTIDRLRSREKQIVKDAQQTELEVQQFQLQKQAALNQICVVVPLRISQIHMFNTSGSLTGPTDKPATETGENLETLQNIERLKDPAQRSLVTDIGLKTHTLFSSSNLVRLKERITELHVEIDAAKEDFRHLHRERGLLTRERDLQKIDIETWSARCKELQMLKFGREIDLDELEANSDQTKEKEAEEVLQNDAEKFKAKSAKLFKTSARLEEELSVVTRRNTKLLNELAELTEMQSRISKELNAPGQVVTHSSKMDNFREIEEQKRIAAYIKFQATELEALRTELNMLKRKEAPPVVMLSQTMPNPPRERGPNDLVLPPIPNNKR